MVADQPYRQRYASLSARSASPTRCGERRGSTDDPGAAAEGNKPYREALEKLKGKTLLPVVECRMNNVVLDKKVKSWPRINFHLIFNPEIAAEDIETFIKNLKVKGTSIGSLYDDAKFLLEEVSVHFGETCHALRNDGRFAGRFLIWIP